MAYPRKPDYARFDGQPAAALYVAEVGGMVKVGWTRRLPQRLRQLSLKWGSVGEFRAFPFENYGHPTERRCIAELAKVGRLVHGREYFSDISIDEARAVVARCIEPVGA